jgi:hypothetical protein
MPRSISYAASEREGVDAAFGHRIVEQMLSAFAAKERFDRVELVMTASSKVRANRCRVGGNPARQRMFRLCGDGTRGNRFGFRIRVIST